MAAPSQAASPLAEAVRALTTAERRIPRSKAYDIETDRYRGNRVWEVKVARGATRPYEFDVRADGRKVVRQAPRPRLDDDVRALASARVTLARALRNAARRSQGGLFDEAEIDRSNGRIVWEATFNTSATRAVKVKIHAGTGRVVDVEVDVSD